MAPIKAEVKNQVINWISDTTSPVVVFSRTTCAFSDFVKDLLKSVGVKPTVVELDQLPNGADILDALYVITNQRTVPNVFIRGRHVGDCDDVKKLHEDRLLMDMIYGDKRDSNALQSEVQIKVLPTQLLSKQSNNIHNVRSKTQLTSQFSRGTFSPVKMLFFEAC